MERKMIDMKAALLKTWTDMEMKDVEKPQINEKEALLKVIYGGVCGSDITVYKGLHPTATAPVVLCHEILATIEELPPSYTGCFKVGDKVTVNPVIECGVCPACVNGYGNVCGSLKLLGIHENGGFAEYTKAETKRLVAVDTSISDEVLSLSEPFAVGYHVNHRSGIRAGDNVLIMGAGPIGIVVAMVAKEFGANRVVISEINEERIKMVQSFGFETVNPLKVDLVETSKEMTNGLGFDIVYEVSGSKAGVMAMADCCRVRGTLMSLSLAGIPYEFPIGKVSFKEMTLVGSRLYSQDHFERGVALLPSMAKKYDLAKLVTEIMPLDDVQKAIDMMQKGENLGKILIKC